MADQHPHPLFVRNLQGGQLRETFLVSAVVSVLAVRFYLTLTGFPQIGGRGLHIAHMLWGGALMVTALLFLLAYLGERIRRVAAILGGLGFGLFIDELGKFITSDNNYFYRPAIALIYVVFVLLFLRLRSFDRHRPVSAEIYLANALVLLQEAAIHELDPQEKRRLIRWLRLSGEAGTDLLGDDAIRRLEARPPDLVPQSRVTRVLRVARRTVTRGLRSRWTERIAVPVLLVRLLGGVVVAGVLALTRDTSLAGGFQHSPLLIATAISSLMAVIGLIRLPLSRIHALRWFKRSILTTILLTDVFVFYYQQLGGLSDLVIDLILLGVFEAIIDAQHTRTSSPSPHAREGPTLSPSPLAGEGRGGG